MRTQGNGKSVAHGNLLLDRAEIMRGLAAMVPEGQVTELRVLEAITPEDRRPHTFGGYFDDPEKLADAVAMVQAAHGFYFIPNLVKPELMARSLNKARAVGKSPTTADHDILRRLWLLVDCDAIRPAGIPSSDSEHEAALVRAADIDYWLSEQGWPAGIIADSGNGGHLLYRIDEPPADNGLVEACLNALSERFSDGQVNIDTSVHNPARIWKLYGTLAGKGDAEAGSIGRPQRMAKVLHVPDELLVVENGKLAALADWWRSRQVVAKPPAKASMQSNAASQRYGEPFNIDAWIQRYGLTVEGPEAWRGGRRWIFPICPWNSDHSNRSAYLIQQASGALVAGCHHNGCRGNGWHELRDAMEPGWRDRNAGDRGQTKSDTAAKGAKKDNSPDTAEPFEPVMVRLSDVTPRAVEWLWQGRIAIGKFTLVAGDPGLGKSFCTLDMAARVSCGNPWPDDWNGINPAGDVVLLSAEDDLEDTIRPRLDAMQANVERIHAFTTVKRPSGKFDPFNLARDLPSLEHAVLRLQNCRLVVIDPITAYLGGTDSHKNADIRGLLAPLGEFAMRHRVAVVAVTHLNKNSGGSALYRAMGSLAFIAAARAGYLVAKDKANEARRLFLPVKNNLGSDAGGLAYSIIKGAVAWEREAVNISADDALAIEKPKQQSQRRASEQQWLRERLAGGACKAEEIKSDAEEAGFTAKSIWKAYKEMGGIPFKEGYGGPWYWRLPAEDSPKIPNIPTLENVESLESSSGTGNLPA